MSIPQRIPVVRVDTPEGVRVCRVGFESARDRDLFLRAERQIPTLPTVVEALAGDLRRHEARLMAQVEMADQIHGDQKALSEGWIALQQERELLTFDVACHRERVARDRADFLRQRDVSELVVALIVLGVTWGPAMPTDARFLVTLIVGSVLGYRWLGQPWLEGNPDANLLAAAVCRGAAVSGALADRGLRALVRTYARYRSR